MHLIFKLQLKYCFLLSTVGQIIVYNLSKHSGVKLIFILIFCHLLSLQTIFQVEENKIIVSPETISLIPDFFIKLKFCSWEATLKVYQLYSRLEKRDLQIMNWILQLPPIPLRCSKRSLWARQYQVIHLHNNPKRTQIAILQIKRWVAGGKWQRKHSASFTAEGLSWGLLGLWLSDDDMKSITVRRLL